MKKIIALIIMLVMIIAAFPVISEGISGSVASANPNKCPQGQTCKWVQHRITSRCKYLPVQSVAYPYEEVPEGICPLSKEENTSTSVFILEFTRTNAVIQESTKTSVVVSTETNAPKVNVKTSIPTITLTPVGKAPTEVTFPTVTPFSFMKSICDTCIEEQRQANAQETMASVLSTQLSRELTKSP